MNGVKKPELKFLPQVKDRMTFLYLERCQLSRKDSAIKVVDASGIYLIPAAQISVLILGPGTSITHDGIILIGDMGVSMVWVGEQGVRYYASGSPLTHRSKLLEKQAMLFSNQRHHLSVAKKMYQKRFDDDVAHYNMNQLRSSEGNRMKKLYRKYADLYHVKWTRRNYNVDDFESGDLVNQALSAGNVCLYGLAHSVIAALGLSPGLGFVHVGHDKSFVYDIADLYKADYTIPLAFKLASAETPDIASEMRRQLRDTFYEKHLLKTMVKDIQDILLDDSEENFRDDLFLWNGIEEAVKYGVAYTIGDYH